MIRESVKFPIRKQKSALFALEISHDCELQILCRFPETRFDFHWQFFTNQSPVFTISKTAFSCCATVYPRNLFRPGFINLFFSYHFSQYTNTCGVKKFPFPRCFPRAFYFLMSSLSFLLTADFFLVVSLRRQKTQKVFNKINFYLRLIWESLSCKVSGNTLLIYFFPMKFSWILENATDEFKDLITKTRFAVESLIKN